MHKWGASASRGAQPWHAAGTPENFRTAADRGQARPPPWVSASGNAWRNRPVPGPGTGGWGMRSGAWGGAAIARGSTRMGQERHPGSGDQNAQRADTRQGASTSPITAPPALSRGYAWGPWQGYQARPRTGAAGVGGLLPSSGSRAARNAYPAWPSSGRDGGREHTPRLSSSRGARGTLRDAG